MKIASWRLPRSVWGALVLTGFLLLGGCALGVGAAHAEALASLANCPSCATVDGGAEVIDAQEIFAGASRAAVAAQDASWAAHQAAVDQILADFAAEPVGTAIGSTGSGAVAGDVIGDVAAAGMDTAGVGSYLSAAALAPVALATADAVIWWHDGSMIYKALFPGTTSSSPAGFATIWTGPKWMRCGQTTVNLSYTCTNGGAPSNNGFHLEAARNDSSQATNYYTEFNYDCKTNAIGSPACPASTAWPWPVPGSEKGIEYHAGSLAMFYRPDKDVVRGTGHLYNASTDPTPDVTTIAPTLPARSTAVPNVQTALANHLTAQKWYQHELDVINNVASPAPDPARTTATLPTACMAGGNPGLCSSGLTAAGFTNASTVTYDKNGADLTKPAGAIVHLKAGTTVDPSVGATFDVSTPIELDVNPAVMPFILPGPSTGETYAAYLGRLQALGYVGTVTRVDSQSVHEGLGPNAVLSTSPAPGVRIAPSDALEVDTNPATAPTPAVGLTTLPTGGSSCGLTPPSTSLNLSPLTSAPWGTAFPLSVVPWLSNAVSGTVAGSQRPQATFSVFGWEISTGDAFAPFDGWITAIRSILAVSLWLGVAWFCYSRTLGKLA